MINLENATTTQDLYQRMTKFCLSEGVIFIKARKKSERFRKGLTEEELAKVLNVTDGAVNHWSSGRNIPNEENRLKLQKLYTVLVNSKNKTPVKIKNVNGYITERYPTLHGISKFDNSLYKFSPSFGTGWTDFRNLVIGE